MSHTVVIHGPQGSGKTRSAQALAAHFNCSRIVDDWNGLGRVERGVLALTSAPEFVVPAWAQVMSFDEAMEKSGLHQVLL